MRKQDVNEMKKEDCRECMTASRNVIAATPESSVFKPSQLSAAADNWEKETKDPPHWGYGLIEHCPTKLLWKKPLLAEGFYMQV